VGAPAPRPSNYEPPELPSQPSQPSRSRADGLVPNAARGRDLIKDLYPGITTGGYSAKVDQSWDEHQTGEAVDFMVGGDTAKGNEINRYLLTNAGNLGVRYTIWQQRTWYPDGTTKGMPDRGSPTENHMDHVHCRFKGGAPSAVTNPARPPAISSSTGSGSGGSGTSPGTQAKSGQAGQDGQLSSEAEQLGHGLVKGIFEELGFPDVFGKPFTEWGIWKLAMGGLGYGKGLTDQIAGQGGAPSSGGGGDPFSALGSLFGPTQHQGSGAPPGPAGIPNAMAPSGSPANVPAGAQGGPQGGNTYVFQNSDYQTAQANWNAHNENNINQGRQVATVGGYPQP
jgi:hypothetical protein